jgi:hypothetical protein
MILILTCFQEPEPADEDDQPPAEAAPTMGETEDAMEYDTELIFKHLYVLIQFSMHLVLSCHSQLLLSRLARERPEGWHVGQSHERGKGRRQVHLLL